MNNYKYNKIKEAFENHKNRLPEDVKVQFSFRNYNDNTCVVCMNLDALWQDWYDECIYCPENDAIILTLWIVSGKNFVTVDAVTSDLLKDFTFEKMMKIIDEVW